MDATRRRHVPVWRLFPLRQPLSVVRIGEAFPRTGVVVPG
jgi:hypothetical protein